MLLSQRIELDLHQVREQIRNETDATKRSELESKATALELRLAVAIAQEANGVQVAGLDAGETAERRALIGRASLRNYLQAACDGAEVDGAEAELNAAGGMGRGRIPWEALAPRQAPRTAPRAQDAATALPATGTGVEENPYVRAIFGRRILGADMLSFDMRMVDAGEQSVPVVASPAANPSAMKAKGGGTNTVQVAITMPVATPHRATVATKFRVEDLARSPGVEAALRTHLSDALAAYVESEALNGTNANNRVNGLFQGLTDPTDPSATVTYESALATVAGQVEGIHARGLQDLRVLVGVKSHEKLSALFPATGSQASAAEYLRTMAGEQMLPGLSASSFIPAPASNIQQAVVARAAEPMGNAALFMWNGSLRAIRDDVTGARAGEIYLTFHALFDVLITRAAAYSQVAFKLA
ncbi:MAG: hypothetical protein F4010_04045 [Cenarchaeum sp. SB0669_bin_11]|nr:hypothetical protein [Acidobacteriota bacterium]MYL11315.1 hypothetical protein [Cenarchaeum sp. SB0669_bin_11]